MLLASVFCLLGLSLHLLKIHSDSLSIYLLAMNVINHIDSISI